MTREIFGDNFLGRGNVHPGIGDLLVVLVWRILRLILLQVAIYFGRGAQKVFAAWWCNLPSWPP